MGLLPELFTHRIDLQDGGHADVFWPDADESLTESAKLERCVADVKSNGDADEPWAVCRAALGECKDDECQCAKCRALRECGGEGGKPGPCPEPGKEDTPIQQSVEYSSRAKALFAKKQELKTERIQTYNQIRSEAKTALAQTEAAYEAISNEHGNIAWDSDDKRQNEPFSEYESAVLNYDSETSVAERFQAFTRIKTAAIIALQTEQVTGTDPEVDLTDKDVANNRKLLKTAVDHAEQARQSLRTYGKHIKEMRAIRHGLAEQVQEGEGTCKPGERADLTGCSPATKDTAGPITSPSAPPNPLGLKWPKAVGTKPNNTANTDLPDASRPKLDDAGKQAAHYYSETAHEFINEGLRGEGEGLIGPIGKAHAALAAAFNGIKDFDKPITVYRAADVGSKKTGAFVAALEAAAQSGKEMEFIGYMSTSTDESFTDKWGGRIRFEIKAKRGMDMQPYSDKPEEKEMLLNHQSRFTVTSVQQLPNKNPPPDVLHMVKMEQI